MAIQVDPLFLLLDQDEEKRRLSSQYRVAFPFLHNDVIKIGSILYIIIQVNIYLRLRNFKTCTILSKLFRC